MTERPDFNWLLEFYRSVRKGPTDADFKKELHRLGFEKEVVKLKGWEPLVSSVEVSYRIAEDYIDKKIQTEIKSLLSKSGIDDHRDGVSSLLKQLYYKRVSVLVQEKSNETHTLYKEFEYLMNMMTEEVHSIKISGRKKGRSCEISNPLLISSFIDAFKAYVLSKDVQLAAELYLANQWGVSKDAISEKSVNYLAAFNLLRYIQVETGYMHNVSVEEALNGKASNKQCELVYNLMCAARIIDNQIAISPKDFIRNLYNRFLKANPQLIHFLNPKKTNKVLDFDINFPDADYITELRRTMDKISLSMKTKH